MIGLETAIAQGTRQVSWTHPVSPRPTVLIYSITNIMEANELTEHQIGGK